MPYPADAELQIAAKPVSSFDVPLPTSEPEPELQSNNVKFFAFRNAALVQKNTALQKAYAEQQEILEIVAHDLRNPLVAISLLASILNKRVEEEGSKRHIDTIAKTTAYMSAMLGQLELMIQIDAGVMQTAVQPVAVYDTLQLVVARNAAIAQQKAIVIDVIAPEKPLVMATSIMLQQIFDNLLSNCINYSQPASAVLVKLQTSGNFTEIQFIDSGLGILAEELPKLFTKFSRLSARPTGAEPSMGLGLYIAKKHVEALGGKIAAKSEGRGKGATFTVTLPTHPVQSV